MFLKIIKQFKFLIISMLFIIMTIILMSCYVNSSKINKFILSSTKSTKFVLDEGKSIADLDEELKKIDRHWGYTYHTNVIKAEQKLRGSKSIVAVQLYTNHNTRQSGELKYGSGLSFNQSNINDTIPVLVSGKKYKKSDLNKVMKLKFEKNGTIKELKVEIVGIYASSGGLSDTEHNTQKDIYDYSNNLIYMHDYGNLDFMFDKRDSAYIINYDASNQESAKIISDYGIITLSGFENANFNNQIFGYGGYSQGSYKEHAMYYLTFLCMTGVSALFAIAFMVTGIKKLRGKNEKK